jgi:hypothetical protein
MQFVKKGVIDVLGGESNKQMIVTFKAITIETARSGIEIVHEENASMIEFSRRVSSLMSSFDRPSARIPCAMPLRIYSISPALILFAIIFSFFRLI